MTFRFYGTIEELKSKLALLDVSAGGWTQVNQNQTQFRHKDGGVMNWYPSTGSITIQGKPAGRDILEKLLAAALSPTQVATSVASLVDAENPSVNKVQAEVKPQVAASINPTGSSPEPLDSFSESEIIIGLVGAVGTEMDEVINVLKDRLNVVGYTTHEIRISKDVIPKLVRVDVDKVDAAERINRLMDAGDEARKKSGDSGILASGVAAAIFAIRGAKKPLKRNAFIVNSLKHPDEVLRLRQIYPRGFYLFGIHPDEAVRSAFLKRKGVSDDKIDKLVERDQDEHLPFGQRVNDTFHLSDFFVRLDNNKLKLEKVCFAFSIFYLEIHIKHRLSMSLPCSLHLRRHYVPPTCHAKLVPLLPKGTRYSPREQMIARSLVVVFTGLNSIPTRMKSRIRKMGAITNAARIQIKSNSKKLLMGFFQKLVRLE